MLISERFFKFKPKYMYLNMSKKRNMNILQLTFTDYQQKQIQEESERLGIGKATLVKWKLFGGERQKESVLNKRKN